MLRFLRLIVGVLLLPLCVAVTVALLDTLRSIPNTGMLLSAETRALLVGYFLWICMWFLMPQPVRVYVVAHELTHALWGLLFGARVSQFRVSNRGGSVRLSNSNFLITPAPYFFPFYTILVVVLRFLLSFIFTPIPFPLFWLFLVGLTWSFHATFTLHSLMTTQQPDIHEYGKVFSYAIIYLFNLAGIGLWVVCTTTASFDTLTAALACHSVETYRNTAEVIIRYTSKLRQTVPPLLKTLFYVSKPS